MVFNNSGILVIYEFFSFLFRFIKTKQCGMNLYDTNSIVFDTRKIVSSYSLGKTSYEEGNEGVLSPISISRSHIERPKATSINILQELTPTTQGSREEGMTKERDNISFLCINTFDSDGCYRV